MAAAYAAVVSLAHIMKQIEHHPRPPISLDKRRTLSLTKTVNFVKEFLESYSSHGGYSEEVQALENRIAHAAHTAEDLIELHIVDRILAGKETNSAEFHRRLDGVIESMDSIKKEALEIEGKLGETRRISPIASASFRSAHAEQRFTTVGLDGALYELLDKLTGGQPDCQIISIVGMGGIGKTTLARKVFENQLIAYHFDVLAWVTVSQEYSIRSLLEQLCAKFSMIADRERLNEMSEDKLGEILYKSLCRERYLVVMDDIWGIEVWDQLRLFFPNKRNGSRIMVTTRLSNLAFHHINFYKIEVKFLDEDASWNLLCKNVFGMESCPSRLVRIGKMIARNCNGLPLSIVVVGGLLARSVQTQKYWEYIARDLNSIVNLEDNERCLKILHMSYEHLPVHLKPCFLYMSVFPEDRTIRVSRLIMLLVGEGFLRPVSGKSLEEVAEDYVKELIDRNLIFVKAYGSDGKVKQCRIHDLLRDLCLKEVEKNKFFCVLPEHRMEIPEMINWKRRIFIYKCNPKKVLPQEERYISIDGSRSEEEEEEWFPRSLIWEFHEPLPSLPLRLLRVCSIANERFPESILQQVNLRYLSLQLTRTWNPFPIRFPSSISPLWNLQILIVEFPNAVVPPEIWKMTLIKHVIFSKARVQDPPTEETTVLENLLTLAEIHNFKCSEDVVKRIPNIKKLKVYYEDFFSTEGARSCLKNIAILHKLESLGIVIDPFPEVEKTRMHLVQNLNFPYSIKKLSMGHTRLQWKDMRSKIGSLPLLEVLKLKWQSFVGPEWETVDGNFRSLKFLLVEFCDLEQWTMESSHFPRLEHVVLRELPLLKEIDSSLGDIPTLKSIQLEYCTDSAVISTKTLLEEQEELGNDDLQVRVLLSRKSKVMESLASSNFLVKT